MRACYHQCRHWLSPPFLAGWLVASTVTFMPEHFLWEKVYPFCLVSQWMDRQHVLPYVFSYAIVAGWIILLIVGIRAAARRG